MNVLVIDQDLAADKLKESVSKRYDVDKHKNIRFFNAISREEIKRTVEGFGDHEFFRVGNLLNHGSRVAEVLFDSYNENIGEDNEEPLNVYFMPAFISVKGQKDLAVDTNTLTKYVESLDDEVGIDVANMSYGFGSDDTSTMEFDIINTFKNRGIVSVYAAGNDSLKKQEFADNVVFAHAVGDENTTKLTKYSNVVTHKGRGINIASDGTPAPIEKIKATGGTSYSAAYGSGFFAAVLSEAKKNFTSIKNLSVSNKALSLFLYNKVLEELRTLPKEVKSRGLFGKGTAVDIVKYRSTLINNLTQAATGVFMNNQAAKVSTGNLIDDIVNLDFSRVTGGGNERFTRAN